MIEIVLKEERRKKICHYCDTWLNVKYKVHTSKLDRVYYGMDGYVYCCKNCATKHYIGNKD